MGIWVPIRQNRWIYFLVVGAFWLAGLFILVLGSAVPAGAGGDLFGSRRTELLFTGIFFIVSPVASIFLIRLWIGRMNRKTLRLVENGIRGSARVISRRETGEYLNNTPEIEFELEVTVPGQEPYTTRMTEHVSVLELADSEPGQTVEVRVDPEDPHCLVLWSGG